MDLTTKIRFTEPVDVTTQALSSSDLAAKFGNKFFIVGLQGPAAKIKIKSDNICISAYEVQRGKFVLQFVSEVNGNPINVYEIGEIHVDELVSVAEIVDEEIARMVCEGATLQIEAMFACYNPRITKNY